MQMPDNLTSFENNHDCHRICKTSVIIKILMTIVMVIMISLIVEEMT